MSVKTNQYTYAPSTTNILLTKTKISIVSITRGSHDIETGIINTES